MPYEEKNQKKTTRKKQIMQNEIFQYYYEQRVQNTRSGTQNVVKEPKGVFTARKTNKGDVVVGCSFLRGDDVFDSKKGLNIARKNAGRTSSRPMTESQKEAYDHFMKRVQRYFFPEPKDSYRKEWNAPVSRNPFESLLKNVPARNRNDVPDMTPIAESGLPTEATKAANSLFGTDNPHVDIQELVRNVVWYLTNRK
jgi:hypothetical protein